jgi:hypothetical protein
MAGSLQGGESAIGAVEDEPDAETSSEDGGRREQPRADEPHRDG